MISEPPTSPLTAITEAALAAICDAGKQLGAAHGDEQKCELGTHSSRPGQDRPRVLAIGNRNRPRGTGAEDAAITLQHMLPCLRCTDLSEVAQSSRGLLAPQLVHTQVGKRAESQEILARTQTASTTRLLTKYARITPDI